MYEIVYFPVFKELNNFRLLVNSHAIQTHQFFHLMPNKHKKVGHQYIWFKVKRWFVSSLDIMMQPCVIPPNDSDDPAGKSCITQCHEYITKRLLHLSKVILTCWHPAGQMCWSLGFLDGRTLDHASDRDVASNHPRNCHKHISITG